MACDCYQHTRRYQQDGCLENVDLCEWLITRLYGRWMEDQEGGKISRLEPHDSLVRLGALKTLGIRIDQRLGIWL